MRPKILFYVQHLLGIGHLVRCHRIARALAANDFDVLIVSGGLPTPAMDIGAAQLQQLTPIKTDVDFAGLLHADGRPFTDGDRHARRDQLLAHFDSFAPDILLTEAFPFGRRQMRFELLPLLEKARTRRKPPLVAVSVRDILQEKTKPGRSEETADIIKRFYDLVLVHGDPHLCRLDETFSLATRFADKIAYTGIVAPSPTTFAGEAHDVIVSAGGGAVGATLLDAALRAKPLSRLANKRWLIVTGPNLDPAREMALSQLAGNDVTIARFLPDLPARLSRATLSISQAGYNTVADLLVAGCRSVLIPFAAGGETEQPVRTRLMERLGLAIGVDEAALTPETLADTIDRALVLPKPETNLALDGAAETGRILLKALRG